MGLELGEWKVEASFYMNVVGYKVVRSDLVDRNYEVFYMNVVGYKAQMEVVAI